MTIEPIAYFKSPFTSKFGIPRQSGLLENLRGEIHLCGSYATADALRGMEDFDRLWLIWEFSANHENTDERFRPLIRPPRLGGNATVGVFASRSPFRPNRLGLSCVKLSRVDISNPGHPVIHVLGADLMDGTPIYDIKPYIPYADAFPDASGGFTDKSGWNALEVIVPQSLEDRLKEKLGEDDFQALLQALSMDPRPRTQNDPYKVYGLPFRNLDIHFNVSEGMLTILDFTGTF